MTSASVSPAANRIAVRRPDTLNVGVIVWLGSEVMFFAGLFAIYFTLRSTNPEVWAENTAILNVPFALTNTIILVASSFTAQFGVWAAEKHRPRSTGVWPTQWGMVEWFFLSYALGAIFVGGQVWEYATLVSEGVAFNSSAYSAAFYLTTGFHGLHVTGGLIAFLLIIGRAFGAKRFGHKEELSAMVVSYYWHFVDVVWIGLFLVIYVVK